MMINDLKIKQNNANCSKKDEEVNKKIVISLCFFTYESILI